MYATIDDNGDCGVKAWLTGLPIQAQVQFRARLERLAEIGHLRSPEEMRRLQCAGEPVSEIKVRSGYRLYTLPHGEDWVGTHGAKKPPDRKVCRQADIAREIWTESHA